MYLSTYWKKLKISIANISYKSVKHWTNFVKKG